MFSMELSERDDLKVVPRMKDPGEAANRFCTILCYNDVSILLLASAPLRGCC